MIEFILLMTSFMRTFEIHVKHTYLTVKINDIILHHTLKVSLKNILTVLSKSATANNLLSGLTLAHCTFSSNSIVFKCNNDNALRSEFGKTTNSNCHNLTELSPPPVIHPS